MEEKLEIDQRDPRTYAIIGAAITVHRALGHGFLEPVYQDSLAIEFRHQQIPFEREKQIPVFYRGIKLESFYKADFICFEDVVVELKALNSLERTHESQLINYLKATGKEYGLLINFGTFKLQHKRLILSKDYLRPLRTLLRNRVG